MRDKRQADADDSDDEKLRLDKWLWAARFFKTRSLAADAIAGGKVEVNSERPKRAKPLQVGDELRLRLGPYEHILTVRALSARRGPASEAAKLYEETAASIAAREKLATQHRLAPTPSAFEGRPSKKDRRDLSRFRER